MEQWGSETQWEEAEHIDLLVLEGVYSRKVGRDGKQGETGANVVLRIAHGEYTGASKAQEQRHEDEKLMMLGLSSGRCADHNCSKAG